MIFRFSITFATTLEILLSRWKPKRHIRPHNWISRQNLPCVAWFMKPVVPRLHKSARWISKWSWIFTGFITLFWTEHGEKVWWVGIARWIKDDIVTEISRNWITFMSRSRKACNIERTRRDADGIMSRQLFASWPNRWRHASHDMFGTFVWEKNRN